MMRLASGLLLGHQAGAMHGVVGTSHIARHVVAGLDCAACLAGKVLPQGLTQVDEPEVVRAA